MTQNFLNSEMATWKTLVHPRLKCMHQQVAVFKKHVSICLVSGVSEATFLLLALALLTAWFSHTPTANMLSLATRARRARRKERRINTMVESLQTLVHLESCQKHRPHAKNLFHRCPRSVRQKLAQFVVEHIMLLGFVLISACCVGHFASECPNKRKIDFILTWQAVLCSMPCVTVQRSKKPKMMKTRMTSKTLLHSRSRVRKGLPFLREVPRRPFGDSHVCHPLLDQYEDTTIETTDVGFTFAGGETETASTKI